MLSGVSLDGGLFFYPNPLESHGQHQRQAWFGCACCPSNISRFIPSIPGYVYAVKDDNVYVNLFMGNTADLKVNGKELVLEQQTTYPLNGDITLNVQETKGGLFTLKVRVPGWTQNQVVPSDLYTYSDGKKAGFSITVNGEALTKDGSTPVGKDGYCNITRKWKKGDKVQIHFNMEPRTVKANERVVADRGRVSVERGPLVYCAEWPDNNFNILSTVVGKNPKFETVEKKDMLYGINMLSTDAQTVGYDANGKIVSKNVKLNLIPYYAWNHRGKGNMMVWLLQDINEAIVK